MRFYLIDPKDHRYSNYIFYLLSDDDYLVLRESYRHLQCQVCKKIDEIAALQLPLEPDVQIQGRFDLNQTSDGMYHCNDRVKKIVEDNGISGIRFIELPGKEDCYVMVPTVEVLVDRSQPGHKYNEPKCPNCGRYREVFGFARLSPLSLPEDPMVIFTPEIWLEDSRGKNAVLLVSQQVMQIMKVQKVSGIMFSELAQSWPEG